jgi:hypothetical protein
MAVHLAPPLHLTTSYFDYAATIQVQCLRELAICTTGICPEKAKRALQPGYSHRQLERPCVNAVQKWFQ